MKKISIIILSLLMIGSAQLVKGQKNVKSTEFRKNNITFALSDVILKRLSFQYERVIGQEGKLSITLPVSYAFDDMSKVYQNMNDHGSYSNGFSEMIDFTEWYVGLGFNMYPAGQGTFRAYFGPELRVGPAHKYQRVYDIVEVYDDPTYEPDGIRFDYTQMSFLLNIGMVYEPTKEIIIGLNVGIGAHSSYKGENIRPQIAPAFRFGLRL